MSININVSEASLLEMLSDKGRQHEAFEILVRQYSRSLYCVIRRIVLVHNDADDILQNTFMKAWRALPMFQGKSKISSWLYRIAVNEALDFVREKKKMEFCEVDEKTDIAARLMADEYFDGNEAEALLQEAVALLPEVQRVVFQLKYYEEMKYSEMREILGTSEGALKASYHIAVKKVQEYIKSRSKD